MQIPLPSDAREQLTTLLFWIERNDTNYAKRAKLVFAALVIALEIGYKAGIRIDPEHPTWPVVFIELPTGQVSWHMAEHDHPWDEHTTEEKYQRCAAFAEIVRSSRV